MYSSIQSEPVSVLKVDEVINLLINDVTCKCVLKYVTSSHNKITV